MGAARAQRARAQNGAPLPRDGDQARGARRHRGCRCVELTRVARRNRQPLLVHHPALSRQPAGDHGPRSWSRGDRGRRAQRRAEAGGDSVSAAPANRLRCESCGAEMSDLDPRTSCPKCGGLLSVEIELPTERGAALRALFDGRPGATPAAARADIHMSGVWRFRELVLPGIADQDLVTQWEGNTPLLARERIARWAEVPNL